MCASNAKRPGHADKTASPPVATPSNTRLNLLRGQWGQKSPRYRIDGFGMREAMRSIVLITAAAFGINAPDAYARNDPVESAAPENPVFQKLDANRDGFISRKEAKKDPAVEAVFSQADANGDGKLSEDEFIKALSISERNAAEKLAAAGASEAKRYAHDSEITARVKAALLQAEGLKSLEISVQTDKGRVQLAGFVDRKDQIAQAAKVAAREPGVKSVLNSLALK